MKELLSIGQFSRITSLTVKALRLYDDLGLLPPAAVDVDSNYRYYRLAQAAEAERIRVLRSLDMPLDEIRALLAEQNPAARRERLLAQRRQIQARIAAGEQMLQSLDHLIAEKEFFMGYQVQEKTVAEQPIVSIRLHTTLAGMQAVFQTAFRELFGTIFLRFTRPAGPPLSLYHDAEFKESDIDMEICVPVGRVVKENGRVTSRKLEGGQVASTIHNGPYPDVKFAYQALTEWAQKNGREFAGPPREIYIVGPDKAKDPSAYRTEVQWPLA